MPQEPQGTGRADRARAGVFVSYSHADQKAFDSVMQHLAVVVRLGHRVWTDRDIRPGQLWHTEISLALAQAKIALLIVTPAFVASQYIANHELPSLLRAAQDDGLTIFWIPWEAADTSEFDQFQAAHPPQRPLATLDRSKRRQQALVAIVNKLKALLSETGGRPTAAHLPTAVSGERDDRGARRGGAAVEESLELQLTDDMEIALDEREAIVAMEEMLYAARTFDNAVVRVDIPVITAARRELNRLTAKTQLTIEERERRARLRKDLQPEPGFPRDVFLGELLTSLVRHTSQLYPVIRSGSDLLECVTAIIGFRGIPDGFSFACFREQGSWSVLFDVPHAVAETIARERGVNVQDLQYNLVELYASEFPEDVRRRRIVPALLWYGGLGRNGASLDNPELFDLSQLRVGQA